MKNFTSDKDFLELQIKYRKVLLNHVYTGIIFIKKN